MMHFAVFCRQNVPSRAHLVHPIELAVNPHESSDIQGCPSRNEVVYIRREKHIK
jgi:hypothetical protein